jgi:apolipoprotein N-acyltransferase
MSLKNFQWFLPILSGIFLVFAFPPFNFQFLLFFGLLPLLFFLDKNSSLKNLFLGGFLTGIIFIGGTWAGTIYWFFDPFFVLSFGIKNIFFGLILLFLFWLLFDFFLALFVGFFSLIYSFLKRESFFDLFLAPSLWVIFEYLRGLAYGMAWLSKENLFGSHWTLSNLAYATNQFPASLFLASLGGIYLVSFLIVFINSSLFYLIRKKFQTKERKTCYLVTFVLAIFFSFYFFYSPPKETPKDNHLNIAILQTKFSFLFYKKPEEVVSEKLQIQTQLLKKIAKDSQKPDIILFPEGSEFLKGEKSQEILSNFFPEKEILIVDSGREETATGNKFVGIFYDLKKGTLGKTEKLLLIPARESYSYLLGLLAKVIGKEKIEKFEEIKNNKKGERMTIVEYPAKKIKIGLLFCSESVSPSLHREMAKKGAEVFLNAGSLAFSAGSEVLNVQTLSMLQFRAAENKRYLVRATNFGSSVIINEKGEIIKITPDFENLVLSGQVFPVSKKSFYTKFGDWILILALFIILFRIFYKKSPKKGIVLVTSCKILPRPAAGITL